MHIKNIGRWFLQGLASMLPVALTLGILYWLGASAEALLGPVLSALLPSGMYFPGLGIIAGFSVVTVIGASVNAFVFSQLLGLVNGAMRKVPLVSTLFDTIQDIVRFADPAGISADIQRPVLVRLDHDVRVIGFVTNDGSTLGRGDSELAVFVPMSYQLGGFTLLLPESRLEPLDMDVQTALRSALSAAMVDTKRD